MATAFTTLTELINQLADRKELAFCYKTEFRTFSYTYDTLAKRVIQWMEFLDVVKVKKGDKLLLWGYNCPEWVIVFLGSIAKGVIVVPIDIKSKEEFVRSIQQEVSAKLLVKSHHIFSDVSIKTLILEQVEHTIAGFPLKAILAQPDPEELVEIVYTSGTTGTPKGVMLTHKNLVTNLNDVLTVMPLQNYRTLSLLPLSHLFEQMINLFLPLATRSTITYLKTMKPSSIMETMTKEKVEVVVLVPRLLEALRNAVAGYDRWPYRTLVKHKLSHLRYFVVGGAPLDPDLERFWQRMGFMVLQGYGLTETSPVVSCNLPRTHKISSVGKVLPSVDVNNVQGELWVKGNSVFQGYYNNPKKTKECFSDGWFKTGDLGEEDNEEFLFIKGRKKDMIVTPEGLNVYPEDIEAVLNKLPTVKDSCVVGLTRKGHEEVHAVLLLKDPTTNPLEVIEKANAQLTPQQQIQGVTVWHLEDFPRTSTLKIKKNIVLEHLEKMHHEHEHHTTNNTTAEEEKLSVMTKKNKVRHVLTEITKAPLSHITHTARLVHDLKLSSIDRVELVSRLEQECHVDLDEESITPETTVEDLEKLVAEQKTTRYAVRYRRWILSWPVRLLRSWVQTLLLFPLTRMWCRIEVVGLENLKDLTTPAIFISNHQSYLDTPVILSALSKKYVKLRSEIAPAVWAEYFEAETLGMKLFKRLAYEFVTFCFNAYLFSQNKGFKKNMEYTGELIDKGFSILLFPEGSRTTTGKVLPFKPGIGMMAAYMKVPIVPVMIDGVFEILPPSAQWPKRGKVNVSFGKPLRFGTESYVEITKILEEKYSAYPR